MSSFNSDITDIEYRSYFIRYEYCLGYAWNHKDIDVDDPRHGFSRTLDEAKADIDEQIQEMADV